MSRLETMSALTTLPSDTLLRTGMKGRAHSTADRSATRINTSVPVRLNRMSRRTRLWRTVRTKWVILFCLVMAAAARLVSVLCCTEECHAHVSVAPFLVALQVYCWAIIPFMHGSPGWMLHDYDTTVCCVAQMLGQGNQESFLQCRVKGRVCKKDIELSSLQSAHVSIGVALDDRSLLLKRKHSQVVMDETY